MKHVLATMLLLACGPIGAQIYEWVDDEGRRHFSDREPVGVEYRRRSGASPGGALSTYRAAVPPSRREAEPSAASSREAAARRVATSRRRARLDRHCRTLHERLDRIRQRLRAGYSEPTGNRLRAERHALNDAWRRDCG